MKKIFLPAMAILCTTAVCGQDALDSLTNAEVDLDDVVISTTRTSRSIQNVPTRIEAVELEEIEEKSNMRPANVSMLLHESTGIQVQQTSATSGNASIRIQGLDGRYTQLLKDGYANFGNFASGLSILEIPPLDLKQVEVIKGPASTLYGAGAIAGVVNFISKTPQKTPEYTALINQTHVGQTNLGVFASQRGDKLGYSMLGTFNLQRPFDVDKDDFTELPKSQNFTLNPKLFFYPNAKSTLIIGNSITIGDVKGGDIEVIKGNANDEHTYFEQNKTTRNISSIEFDRKFSGKNHLTARSSFSYFDRTINLSDYSFAGVNYNSFSDISYAHSVENQTLILGANFIYDQFSERNKVAVDALDFTLRTGGLYAQHTWDITPNVMLESGLRGDVVSYDNQNYNKTEWFILPRISALFKINRKWSSRIGGGMGYKTPTAFTEQTETMQYRQLMPLNGISSEKSFGGTADVNYKTPIGEYFYVTVNQMFFYTRINNATLLQEDDAQNYFFTNTDKPVVSRGFETNLRVIFMEDVKLFAGYTFTDARAKYLQGNQILPLQPKNKINLALIYEKERNFKIGLEGYYTDHQYLSNGFRTATTWDLGAMVEKTFGKVTLFLNFENFTDERQSRHKGVMNEPHNHPTFDEIWQSHNEGIVVNGGVKLKW